MGKKKTTEVAVVSTNEVLNQFFQIDFQSMNAVIEKLANRGSLSKTEKKEANAIIDTWNENVIDKLTIEEQHISSFVNSLNGQIHNGIPAMIRNQMFIDELEMLFEYAGLQSEYTELCDTIDEYTIAENIFKSITRPDENMDTTNGERIKAMRDYEFERTKANMEVSRIGNKLVKLNTSIVAKLMADENVRKLITQLKKRASNMKKMKTTCTDKAQLAKINITIDDENVRATLKELVEMTKF